MSEGKDEMPREMVEIDGVRVIRTTDKALLCMVDKKEVWIPKSQLGDDSDLTEDSKEGDEGVLEIPEWLAEEKDL